MKGTVTKLNAYKNGNGYFIGIDHKEIDCMFYGFLDPDIMVGDRVEYELGKPKNDHPTIKSIKPSAVEAFIDEDKPRSAPILRAHDQGGHSSANKDSREAYWAAKEARDIAQEPIINRRYCLSSAAQVYSGAQGADEKILALAAKFEKFVKGDSP